MATVREQIMNVMADGTRRTLRQIVDLVEAPKDQVHAMASKMVQAGQLVRPQEGWYCTPQAEDQIPQFVAQPVAEADPEADETAPPLQLAYWSDGDVVLRRGDESPLVLSSSEVGELVAFLARTGHCYTHGELVPRED